MKRFVRRVFHFFTHFGPLPDVSHRSGRYLPDRRPGGRGPRQPRPCRDFYSFTSLPPVFGGRAGALCTSIPTPRSNQLNAILWLRNQNRSIGRVTTAEFDCRALNSIAPPSDSNSRSGGPEARALPLSYRNKPKSAKILAELMRSYACASVCTMTKRVLNVWGIRKSAYQLIYFRNIPFSVSQFTY